MGNPLDGKGLSAPSDGVVGESSSSSELLSGGLKLFLGICLKNDEFRVVTASPDLAVIIEPLHSVTL